MEQPILTLNEDETIVAGVKLAAFLKPTDVVFLKGELGSGKTTFTKGIAKGLGIDTRVISPTFVVLRTHQTGKEDIRTLYHLDLYRLQDEKEVKGIDLKDYLEDPAGIVVIEWPEVGQNLVEKKVWNVKFETLENNARKITISYE